MNSTIALIDACVSPPFSVTPPAPPLIDLPCLIHSGTAGIFGPYADVSIVPICLYGRLVNVMTTRDADMDMRLLAGREHFLQV